MIFHSAKPSDPFQSVFDHLNEIMRRKERALMAIDGMCASGKSALAKRIAERYASRIFHMDDFFLTPQMRRPERLARPGGNIDVERFEAEVLQPLLRGDTVHYRKYDCKTDTFIPQPPIEPKPLGIVEGEYSLHPRIRHVFDFSVGLRVSPDVQLRRIAAREGEAQLSVFRTRWIPLEEKYFKEYAVRERCDHIFKNSKNYHS